MTDRPRSSAAARLSTLWGFLPVLLFVTLTTLAPLLFLLVRVAQDFGGAPGLYAQLFGPSLAAQDARLALGNSLTQGLWSALGAFALGYPVGLLLGRYRFPGRQLLSSSLLVTFLLPSLLVVLGIQDLFGTRGLLSPELSFLGHGLAGIVVANVFFNLGVVALFTSSSIENASRPQEEAAALLGASPGRIFRDVWGRASLLGAGAGALLTFLFSFLGFAAPLLLGGAGNATVEVWIYTLARGVFASPGLASVLTLWTVLFLAGPSLVYLFLVRRTSFLGGVARGSPGLRPLRSGGAGAAVLATVSLLIAAAVGLLLVEVIVHGFQGAPGSALTLANFSSLFSSRSGQIVGIPIVAAIGNSLFYATLASLLVLSLSLVTAYVRARRGPGAQLTDLLVFAPLLVSPVILALSLETFYTGTLATPPLLWVLIVLSEASLALPFALQSVTLGLRSVPPEPREAGRTLGASSWRAFVDGDLSGLRGSITSAVLFAFALGLGEFAATNFLYIPSYATTVVAIYQLGNARALGAEAALATLLAVLSLVLFVGLQEVLRRVRA